MLPYASVGNCNTGRYNFLHREWGPNLDDSMPNSLKKRGFTPILSAIICITGKTAAVTTINRYSPGTQHAVRRAITEGESVGEPPIPEVLRVPQNKPEARFRAMARHDWANRELIQQEADFPQTKVLTPGAILSIKIMPKIIGYCRLDVRSA